MRSSSRRAIWITLMRRTRRLLVLVLVLVRRRESLVLVLVRRRESLTVVVMIISCNLMPVLNMPLVRDAISTSNVDAALVSNVGACAVQVACSA